jgi:hypothetical protein
VPESYIIAKIGDASHRLDFVPRDFGMLVGKNFLEGERFIKALGVFEHITVAGGIPKGSHVIRSRRLFLDDTELLLRAVQRDEELLRYDYRFSFAVPSHSTGGGAESGFRVRGFVGHIDTRPRGFCWLQLSQVVSSGWPRIVEWIDMRVRGSIETDERGTLQVHRKKAVPTKWFERLPPFIEFLRSHSEKEVTVEHYD